jgi:phospholipid transport system substrate-binding protein
LRASGGSWKIIDVFYRNSISQIATRRSDFASIMAKSGAKALIAHLDSLAAKGDF